MTKLLLAALVFAVLPTFASAEPAQRGFGPLKRAIEKQTVAEKGPCAVASSFEGATYQVTLPPQEGRPTKMTFVYKGCSPYYAEEAPHGRLSEDEAITTFTDEAAGYNLVVVTPAGHHSGRSTVTLVKDVHTTSLGDVDTLQILLKDIAVSLGYGVVVIRK